MRNAKCVKDIIDLLHIDLIGRKIESVHDMIREAYTVKNYVVGSYDEFKDRICHYYNYHYMSWLRVPVPDSPPYADAAVTRLLENNYEPRTILPRVGALLDNGYKSAVKNSRTGRHGGFVAVIDAVAEGLKKEAVQRYVSAVFFECVDPMNFDKRVSFMAEYLRMFGDVLLPAEDLVSVYELAVNLEAVIQNHVRLVNEFRKTLQ